MQHSRRFTSTIQQMHYTSKPVIATLHALYLQLGTLREIQKGKWHMPKFMCVFAKMQLCDMDKTVGAAAQGHRLKY